MGKIEFTEDEMVEEIIEAKLKAAEPEIKARKRTLVGTGQTYETAQRAASFYIAKGTCDPKNIQIRRRSNGFGVFLREWVK